MFLYLQPVNEYKIYEVFILSIIFINEKTSQYIY